LIPQLPDWGKNTYKLLICKIIYKIILLKCGDYSGNFYYIPIPNNCQYWQPKPPTLIPQLPDWGKNTYKLLICKIIYKIILLKCGDYSGNFYYIPIPNNCQYWQPKPPTLIPQLPDWGKNTYKLLICKIIYKIILL